MKSMLSISMFLQLIQTGYAYNLIHIKKTCAILGIGPRTCTILGIGSCYFQLIWHSIYSNPSSVQNERLIMKPVSTQGCTMFATKGKILHFSTPKSPENALCGIFTHLNLVLKYYKFAIFQHILCKTLDESLRRQAEFQFWKFGHVLVKTTDFRQTEDKLSK